MDLLQWGVHYGLHFIFPGIIAYVFFKKKWKQVWLVLLLTNLIDLDHLWATPIFDPNRCSINFHFLHSYQAATVYLLFLFFKRTRLIGIGILLHLVADFIDCLW